MGWELENLSNTPFSELVVDEAPRLANVLVQPLSFALVLKVDLNLVRQLWNSLEKA